MIDWRRYRFHCLLYLFSGWNERPQALSYSYCLFAGTCLSACGACKRGLCRIANINCDEPIQLVLANCFGRFPTGYVNFLVAIENEKHCHIPPLESLLLQWLARLAYSVQPRFECRSKLLHVKRISTSHKDMAQTSAGHSYQKSRWTVREHNYCRVHCCAVRKKIGTQRSNPDLQRLH